LQAHSLRRRKCGAFTSRAKPQTTSPHIELPRIAFARRKTAWATSLFDWSALARAYSGERRSGIVRSLAAPDSASRVRQTLQGPKPQERRPVKRRGLREIKRDEGRVRAAQLARSGRFVWFGTDARMGKQLADWFGGPFERRDDRRRGTGQRTSMTPRPTKIG
jgi:hypothetical protein